MTNKELEVIVNQYGFHYAERYAGFFKDTNQGGVVLINLKFVNQVSVAFLRDFPSQLVGMIKNPHRIKETGCTTLAEEIVEFLENLEYENIK